MTGIFLLDAVLVMFLIVLTVLLYRLLDMRSLVERYADGMKVGISAALVLPVYAFAAATIPLLLIYGPIDLYVRLERTTGISTGWWALLFYVLIAIVLLLIWAGYAWILGLCRIRKHVANIELNGAGPLTARDYATLIHYINERLKVGEVPMGSFAIRAGRNIPGERVPVAVFKN